MATSTLFPITPARILDSTAAWESPVPKLLGTNVTPCAKDEQRIWAVVAKASETLADIDIDISKAQAVLDALNGRREPIQRFHIEHQALLTPARRLPSDILAMIFLEVAHTEFVESESLSFASTYPAVVGRRRWPTIQTMEPLKGASLIAQVCRGWRELALASPRIWSYLSIFHGRRGTRKMLTALRSALQRSGACSLTIDLAGDDMGWTTESDGGFERCIAILVAHAPRWREVRLRQVPCGDVQKLLQNPHLSFTSLKHLDIAGVRARQEHALLPSTHEPGFRAISGSMPVLDTLHLPSLIAVPTLSTHDFPWALMRHLHIAALSIAQLEILIPEIPILERLRCSLDHPRRSSILPGWPPEDDDETESHSVVLLSSLRSLHLDGIPHGHRLRTPALRDLCIGSYPACANPSSHGAIASFLERNAMPLLERLDLTDCILDAQEIIPCLECVPGLIVFKCAFFIDFVCVERHPGLTHVEWQVDAPPFVWPPIKTSCTTSYMSWNSVATSLDHFDHVLRCLTDDPSQLVPNLSTLEITDLSKKPGFDDTLLLDVVRARREYLRTVRVHTSTRSEAHVVRSTLR